MQDPYLFRLKQPTSSWAWCFFTQELAMNTAYVVATTEAFTGRTDTAGWSQIRKQFRRADRDVLACVRRMGW